MLQGGVDVGQHHCYQLNVVPDNCSACSLMLTCYVCEGGMSGIQRKMCCVLLLVVLLLLCGVRERCQDAQAKFLQRCFYQAVSWL